MAQAPTIARKRATATATVMVNTQDAQPFETSGGPI
jgi:hypothetical protein